ncbi:MAG: carboxypeptidase regulatory-like domain-containing protein [Saprospiraceae bacterium]|nr:carboxypeptidase regulatory-like domain-containing protein [Saprospiraceae bacterium]
MIRIYPLLCILLFSFGCAKDIEIFVPHPSDPNPNQGLVLSNLTGILANENGDPIAGTDVFYGDGQTQTDENGVFYFAKVAVPVGHAVLELEVPGYFVSKPIIYAQEGSTAFIRVVLRERIQTGSFMADQSQQLSLSADLSIQIEGNSLVDPSGTNYPGDVAVFSSRYDPGSLNDVRQIPGSSIGIDATEKEVAMEALVAFVLEFDGSNGQKLHSETDSDILVDIQIPVLLQGEAPPETALWYFDGSTGLWVEKGTAIRSGDLYSCLIDAPGTWAVAKPYDYIQIEGYSKDLEDRRFVHTGFSVQFPAGNYFTASYVDSKGAYQLRIPKGVDLQLNLLDDCDEEMYSTVLGGLAGNTVVPPMIVDMPEAYQAWLRGVLVSCNEDPLDLGYVLLKNGIWTKPVLVDETGAFASHVSACGAETFVLEGVSLNAPGANSLQISHPFILNMELGQINVCEALPASFAGFNVDGEPFLSTEASGIPQGNQTFISDSDGDIALLVPGISTGLYSLDAGTFSIGPYSSDQIIESLVQVVFDSYGQSGENIRGSVNGYFTDSDGNDHWVFGRFRALIP